ncbi:hypothetical protein L6452_39035 [Arctium lappa]|uniref:Uncharacterized protein n=1 Tax=Arctium lappa TaxID=4217 RepID=A0ACB8XSW5_ARCLA|nr:hypothetical protein L6452_39035 [Arctium lappa]
MKDFPHSLAGKICGKKESQHSSIIIIVIIILIHFKKTRIRNRRHNSDPEELRLLLRQLPHRRLLRHRFLSPEKPFLSDNTPWFLGGMALRVGNLWRLGSCRHLSISLPVPPSDLPLVILGHTISEQETLGVLIVCSIVLIFLTNVGSILISVLLTRFAIVCFHGAFKTSEDLFLDEQESGASTGFSHSSKKVDINDPVFV